MRPYARITDIPLRNMEKRKKMSCTAYPLWGFILDERLLQINALYEYIIVLITLSQEINLEQIHLVELLTKKCMRQNRIK